MTFQVLNALGSTINIQALSINGGTVVTQSVPTNPTGTAMIGSSNMANSLPVVIATDQAILPVNLSQFGGNAITLGAAGSAVSIPVVLATNQATLTTVLGSPLPAGTNAIGTVSADLIQVGGAAFTLGALGSAVSLPVVLATNQAPVLISDPSVGTTGTTAPAQATLIGANVNGTMQYLSAALINATTFALDVNIASGSFSVSATNPSVSTTGTTAPSQASLIGINVNGTMQYASGVQQNSTTFLLSVNVASGSFNVSATNPSVSTTGQATPAQAGLMGVNVNGTMQAMSGFSTNATTFPGRVDLLSVGGSLIVLGAQGSAVSLPVVIATNQATLTATITGAIPSGTNAIGTVSVTGTPGINISQVLGSAVQTAGVNGLMAFGGQVASGATVGGFPLLIGGRAQTGEYTAFTNGEASILATDPVGKPIILPYANPQNFTSGATTAIASTQIQVISSTNGTNRLYITSLQFGNTSGSTIFVTLNDPETTDFIVPAGGGSNIVMPVPLRLGLGSALLASCSVGVSTAYISAQGYSGQ